MGHIFAIGRSGPRPTDGPEARPSAADSLATLGAWMIGLGAIRMIGELVEAIARYQGARVAGLAEARGWLGPLVDDPLMSLATFAWPVVVGLWLRRSRTRELARAAALTFLFLAIGGAMATVAGWSPAAGKTFPVGSFRLPKQGWDHLSPVTWAAAIAGAGQLGLELLIGIVTLFLSARGAGGAPGPGPEAAEADARSRAGRLALYGSAAFLAMTIRLPAAPAFVELLSRSPTIRAFLLREDYARIGASPRRTPRGPSEWVVRDRTILDEAERDWYEGKYPESATTYRKLVAEIEAIPAAPSDELERRFVGQVLNNWAWFLATCPREDLRDREAAVSYARRSLELEPDEAATWNTLGVAYYRLEKWDDALSALYRSMDLSDEGGSVDWFFLAMIHKRLGHEARAREWYEKAARAITTADPQLYGELYRFETEAAALLKLPRPEPPRAPVVRRYPSRRSFTPDNYPSHRGPGMHPEGPRSAADAWRPFRPPPMVPRPVQ